ncbi:MAG: winged helix-turn-helix domain-containing protein [Cypionkella sp.]
MESSSQQNRKLDLGSCQLELDSGLVLRDGRVVPLRARPLEVLRYLASRPGQVVSKSELMEAVWKNVVVTDDSLTQAVHDIRMQIEDGAGQILRTAARRGYMLVPKADAPSQHALKDLRARIGILPFADLTQRAENAALISWLNDETATGLSRFKTVVVLSPRSVAVAASTERDPIQLATALSANYLLYGTARPTARKGFRLSIELIGHDGALVWADVFDCSGVAMLDQPDVIPRRILGYLNASLEDGELARIRYRPTSSLTAMDRFARGLAILRRADPDQYAEAKTEFDAACSADPSFGLAHSYAAESELSAAGFGLAPAEIRRQVVARAQRGVDLAPIEARTLSMLGFAQLFVREFDAAEHNITAAQRLNPFSVDIMRNMAILNLSRGRHALALDWLARIAEISPVSGPHEDILRFEAFFQLGQFDEAAAAVGRVAHPDLRQRVWAATIAAMRGDTPGALRELEAVSRIEPSWDHLGMMTTGYDYEHQEDTERMLEGVRRALKFRGGSR